MGPWLYLYLSKYLQPVKLTRNPYKTQRLRLWGCPRNLVAVSCWWAQCFLAWLVKMVMMLTFWFGVMAFMIDTGWVENCGLLTLAVLVFELVPHCGSSAICALTVAASLAYSIAGWQQWQHVSLPLRVSLSAGSPLSSMGSMLPVFSADACISSECFYDRQQQQPPSDGCPPLSPPMCDIVSLFDWSWAGRGTGITSYLLSDTPTYISCLWPCVRDRST